MLDLWGKPFIRWAGSKRKLLAHIVENIPPQYDRYVEPFAGSACIFFAIKPPRALLADFNPDLMHTYQMIKKHPRIVARKIEAIARNRKTYYTVRATKSDGLTDVEKAVRFLYLNRLCFNGVYRTNRKGQFNVPMGTKTGEFPSEAQLYRCSYALRQSEIECLDFEETLKLAKEGDFVYLDPPYASSGSKIEEYGNGTFDFKDLKRLYNAMYLLDDKNIPFLLSYANIPELEKYNRATWVCKKLKVNRHVGGFAERRKTVSEVLISNKPFLGKEGLGCLKKS